MWKRLLGLDHETELDLSEVPCPSCGEILPEASVDIETMIAVCPSCQKKSRLYLNKFEAGKPSNIEVHKSPDKLEFEIRWFRFFDWIGLFSVLLFMPFVWFLMMQKPDTAFEGLKYSATFFTFVMATVYCISLGWFYYRYHRKTTVSLDANQLEVVGHSKHFFQQNHVIIQIAEIDQFYYTRRREHLRKNQAFLYDLHVRRKESDLDELLIRGLEGEDQARFIEQEIEAFLGIKDRHIQGSYFSEEEPAFGG